MFIAFKVSQYETQIRLPVKGGKILLCAAVYPVDLSGKTRSWTADWHIQENWTSVQALAGLGWTTISF